MAGLFRNTIIAERYAHHRDNHDDDFVDQLANQLDVGGRVIDIGAGAGAPAAALARRGIDVLAIEPSAAMIAQGRRRHPGVRFLRAWGEDLPLRAGSAAAALVMYVLHHADDPTTLLAEAARVVAPGGPIVVVTGRADSDRQELFRGYFPTLVPDLPGADEIWWWAAEAGLQPEACRTAVHHVYPNRTIDSGYIEMVECEMFAALRLIDPVEFDDGLRRLRADIGRPLPPPEVTVLTLSAGEQVFRLESSYGRSSLLI